MGLLNSHQILKGARNYAGEKTYSRSIVTQKPAYTVTGDTVSFTSGVLEVEGQNFNMAGSSLDFGNLGALILNGKNYIITAVPKYDEPANQAAAETAGLSYYVNSNPKGEAIASTFINSTLQGQVDSVGGWDKLMFEVYRGSATNSQVEIFHNYGKAVERLKDPRYAIFPLKPTGFEFVLAEVMPQDNFSVNNVFLTRDEAYYNLTVSQLGEIYKDSFIGTATAADTLLSGRPFLVDTITTYTSAGNAQTNTNPVTATFNGTSIATSAGGGATNVRVTYHSYPSTIALGMEGDKPDVLRILARQDSSFLGRVNPIYLENIQPSVRVSNNSRHSPLTRYADPAKLIEVKATVSGSITLTLVKELFDTI